VHKKRLLDEGNESVTNCNALKTKAHDKKMRLTDVADTEKLFRSIQSITSPKAESKHTKNHFCKGGFLFLLEFLFIFYFHNA